MPSNKDLCIVYTPGIISFFALVLGASGSLYCETVSFTPVDGDDSRTLYAGVTSYREYDSEVKSSAVCLPYSGLEDGTDFVCNVDGLTTTVIVLSLCTMIIGSCAVLYAFLAHCCVRFGLERKKLGVVFILLCILQGLSLLILDSSICLDNPFVQFLKQTSNSEENHDIVCEPYIGTYLIIAAVVLWFLAGVAAIVLPIPVLGNEHGQTQTITYQRNTDGKVEETNVHVVKGTNVPPPEEPAKEKA